MNLKDILKEKLTKKELELQKTSFDVVGDIAIIEIPKELEKKEKIIGNALLKLSGSIKTVVKKVGIHKGEFRLQEHKVIAGENKKTTTYKENGCEFLINIDETYFSSRLGTERLRITKLVKDKEDILVMFSGIAPYPITIAKNTNANVIYGIELNPKAHEKALINVELNRIKNVFLINNNAHNVKKFFNLSLGWKTAINKDNFDNKYSKLQKYNNKPIIELFVAKEHLKIDKKVFLEIFSKAQELNMHQIANSNTDIKKTIENTKATFEFLTKTKIKKKTLYEYISKIIIHPPVIKEDEYKEYLYQISKLIKEYKELKKKIFFENMPDGYFSPENTIKLAKDLKINNVCYDLGHHIFNLFAQKKKNIKKEVIKFLDSIDTKKIKFYFHIMNFDIDTKKDHLLLKDEFILKKIKKKLFDKITTGIAEVKNKDESKPNELIKSFKFIDKQIRAFDRILMPLPKDAELFLEDALKVAKKGTIIHLYHFSHIDELDSFKKKLLKIANNRIKIKDVIKCGDYSPQVHRWCFDLVVKG